MIISKTPFRVSFFGGGTDFKDYYERYGGYVIGSAINKYCYITLRQLPPFFKEKYRLVWSKIELVNNVQNIAHPCIRSVLKNYNIKNGLEIIHASDLPARSGIGSSSSFSVGLIHCINILNNKKVNKLSLAKEAINLEQNILKEHVGTQDQIWATCGGFNEIYFNKKGFEVKKIKITEIKKKELSDNLIMFFTGKSRYSEIIEKNKMENLEKKLQHYHIIKEFAINSKKVFEGSANLDSIGYMLDEYWKLKKKLSVKISDKNIDEIYKEGKRLGALGGKILGAGGGGFIMFYANQNVQKKLINKFYKLTNVKFNFSNIGSEIIFNNE